MIVRGQRVDGVIIWDWVCGCAGRPCPKLGGDQATRRTAIGPHSPPPPCIYVFPGDIPSAEAPLATAQPLASVELLAAFHAAFEGREEEHFVDLELAQNGSSRRRRTVIRPRTARNFSRRFGVRYTSPRLPEGARLASRAPACIMVRGDHGAVGRAAGPVRLPQDVKRISDDPACREPRDHRPGGQWHRQLVDQSRVR